jgi:hypothetical protein
MSDFNGCGRRAILLGISGVLIFMQPHASHSQNEATGKPGVSNAPLTSEQLAVYRGAAAAWFENDKGGTNLATLTDPVDQGGFGYDKKCAAVKGLEAIDPKVVHRFRSEDLAQLGSIKFRLVDPDDQRKEIGNNDPGKAIRNGTSVDEAVTNGFHHALFTFSEIQFDKEHNSAVVSFSIVCGRLCGNGSTMVMKRQSNGEWKRIRSCGGWVS